MKNITVQTNFSKYLVNYYKKESQSFITHFEKAKNIPNEKNIHQLRVDVKKLRAIFNILQLLFPEKFNVDKFYALYRPIFKRAGKVREVQVNLALLAGYKLSPFIIKQYGLFCNEKEESGKKKLKKALADFKIDRLDKQKLQIKKLLRGLKNEKINAQHHLFITKEIKQIKQLLLSGNDPAIIHKMRMHLKSLSAIGSLFYKINPDKELKKLLAGIIKNATLIGDWHDKIILVESLELFLIKNNELHQDDLILLSQVVERIKKENELFVIILKNSINPILKIPHSIVKL